MYKTLLCFFLLLTLCTACKDKKEPVPEPSWSEIPEARALDSLKSTDFVPTLENPINPSRNTVYAAALLYAWDTLVKLLPAPLVDDAGYSESLNLLRRSVSFRGSLKEEEYRIRTEVSGTEIIAEAFFNKTLPFPALLEKAPEPMSFSGQPVKAFGMYHLDEKITAFCQILYYDNDESCLLKIAPKEKEHEIWLLNIPDSLATLAAAVQKAVEWKATGEKQAGEKELAWKYRFHPEDIFSIPELRFNLFTHYRSLEGQVLRMKGETRTIATAYQRTGFILNETGAVAESHAVLAVDSATAAVPEALPPPKKLLFNQPFYVILKRTDAAHPYFVMRVAHPELMVKP